MTARLIRGRWVEDGKRDDTLVNKMKATKTITQDDCVNCGACCWMEHNNEGHTVLNKKDIERLKPLGIVVQHKGFKLPVLRNKPYKDGGIVCSALQGTVGEEVACGIYSIRPSYCARYQPGGKACLAARARQGL